MDRDIGAHRSDEQRAETLHGNGADDDFGHEQRTRDRRVVGRRDSGGGAAGDEQSPSRCGSLSELPTLEPIRAASCTIGPSRPIEPPEAMVKSEEMLRISVGRAAIVPSPTTTASM